MKKPERTRSLAKFDDNSHGMVIVADKIRQDIQVLRGAADMLARLPGTEQYVGALRSLAAQYEQASNGEEPQAL